VTIPRKLVNLISDGYIVYVYILSSFAFVTLILGDSSTPDDGSGTSPVFKIAWGIVYAVSVLRIYRHRHEAIELIRANKIIVFMVLLAFFSYRWSIDSSTTLQYGARLLFTTIFIMDLSLRYSLKRQLQLLCAALLLTIGMSVIAEVFFPGLIPSQQIEVGAWHGIFPFKNDFGRIICLGTIACLALSRPSTLRRGLILVSGIVLAILSQSASAVGYTLFLAMVMVMWSVLKWRPKPRLAALLLLSVTAVFAIRYVSQNFDQLLAKMDKDPHMTGRVDLWEYSIDYIQQRPLLGYGYTAFWGVDSQPARRIREAVHWDDAPHAHNAYIDLALSLGMVGLVTYFVMYFIVVKRSFRFFMSGPENYRRWPLSYMAFVLIYQCTESGIVGGNNILWIIFGSIAFSLSIPQEDFAVQEDTPLPAAVAVA
jgi:exopolysaccharide production protein ExoQ